MEFSFQHCNFIIEVMIGTQNLYLQKSTECDMQKVFKQYYNRIDNESSEKIQQYNYVDRKMLYYEIIGCYYYII